MHDTYFLHTETLLCAELYIWHTCDDLEYALDIQ
jgi:hypothetical protein